MTRQREVEQEHQLANRERHLASRSGCSHKSVSTQINSWTKLGNGDPDFVKLFNRLSSKRGQARYDASDQVAPPSDDELAIAERVAAALAEAVKQRG